MSISRFDGVSVHFGLDFVNNFDVAAYDALYFGWRAFPFIFQRLGLLPYFFETYSQRIRTQFSL